MASRFARQEDKGQNERHAKILKQLMMQPANKKCADCRKKDPRWCSWNIGTNVNFRRLFVYSVQWNSSVHWNSHQQSQEVFCVNSSDLDTWTPEQVENMVRWGNEKAK